VGSFIQALAVTTKMPEEFRRRRRARPKASATTAEVCSNQKENAQKNRFGEEGKTFQRKRIPRMPPALAIKLGQSKPSSKERTVPEIAHWLNPVAHAGGNV